MNSTIDKNTLIDACRLYIEEKKIDKASMTRILEDIFKTMYLKKYGCDEKFDVIVNIDKGDLEMYQYRLIVPDDIEDYNAVTQIYLSDAKKIEDDFEVGEEVAQPVFIDDEFTRRNIHLAKQTLLQKIKDLEKDSIYDIYKGKEGDLLTAEAYQILSRDIILLDDEGRELYMPKYEMIPNDNFRKGDLIRCVVKEVNFYNKQLKVIVSRTSPIFLERLFENEIPEIKDGIIGIKKIVRKPGERAKVAVESFEERIDPVGACVGMKGSRIHSTVKELRNENIDVINYSDNLELYIKRALKPATIDDIKVNYENRTADIYLKQEEVSKAIGKNGLNIKLASRLVDYEINVYRNANEIAGTEEDIELSEFNDVVEEWILDELRKVGLDTARNVLELTKEELCRRTDLEMETIEEVLVILQKEFD